MVETADAAEADGKQWVIDFREVGYLSRAGIRSLLKLAKSIRQLDGTIFLAGLVPQVQEVLDISGLLYARR